MSLSLDCIAATARRPGEWVTAMREVGPPAINAWRIAELEKLAKRVRLEGAAREIPLKLAEIESSTPLYPKAQIALAVAMASGCFAHVGSQLYAIILIASAGKPH